MAMSMTSPRIPGLHQRGALRERGMTLVEVMIAMAIGFVLMLGLSFLIAEQSRDRGEIDKAGKQIENGRLAITLLTDEIQMAGYYGEFGAAIAALTALPDPCDVSSMTTLASAMAMPVQGYNAPASAALPTCIATADFQTGTDILVVRRASSAVTALGSIVAGLPYLQATPAARVLDLGNNATPFTLVKKDNTTVADLRRYYVYIYFISKCNNYASGATTCTAAADNGTPVPTLKRIEITASGTTAALTTVSLVEGVENMQLDYGVDSTLTGVPDSPSITAPAVAQWPNVMLVTVNLLARSNEPSMGWTDSKLYNMGLAGNTTATGDRFKRHVYTASVRVMNPSQRRE